jgi:hypothetical protein
MNSKLLLTIIIVVSLSACIPTPKQMSAPFATVTRIPSITPFPTSTLVNTAAPLAVESSPTDEIYSNPDVAFWNGFIEQDPQNFDAHYQRARAIYLSNRPVGSIDVYKSRLILALQDINTAISLRSDNGGYYSLRLLIYDALAGTTDYTVDSQYLGKLALDDARKAVEFGTLEEYPERTIINELIASNQCKEALANTEEQIAKLPSDDPSLGGLLHIRSRAYACLGRLNDALNSVNDSMFNNENMGYKNELKAQYLILLGHYTEALPLLNEQICHCELAGWHYYLRAEIYFNTDKKDLVQDELSNGMMRTWGRGGMLPYVEAQVALDEGRKDDAIQLLQFAEATFTDPIYNSLRWKIQDQLKAVDTPPLSLTPSFLDIMTPIP